MVEAKLEQRKPFMDFRHEGSPMGMDQRRTCTHPTDERRKENLLNNKSILLSALCRKKCANFPFASAKEKEEKKN